MKVEEVLAALQEEMGVQVVLQVKMEVEEVLEVLQEEIVVQVVPQVKMEVLVVPQEEMGV